MKVAIITLHRVYNYGSVLQAYATQKVLEKENIDAYIIDYYSPIRTPQAIRSKYPVSYSPLKRFIYLFFKKFSVYLKEKTFGGFLNKYVKLSKNSYITYDDILADIPKADIYMTGSDQVWNSIYNEGIDKAFYLQFVPSDKKKVAFVSSFGLNSIPKSEQLETQKYLSEYNAISVREKEALDILADLSYQNGVWLIDPTLQLSKSEWLKLASKRLVKKRYLILMLLYQEDNEATNYARWIAEKRGLKLVKICWEIKKDPRIDIMFTHRCPQDFLSLFANADFVVTNSFHGLAFAINFNKQFIVVPRNEFNSRITNLLELVGLKNRLIISTEQLSIIDDEINFENANRIIKFERERAKKFILKNVKDNLN